jgi:hypothetical protein
MKTLYFFAKVFSLCAMIHVTGCETLTTGSPAGKKKKKDDNWSFFKRKEYQIPHSMNVTWASDVITLPGKLPTRGFGGRFYFYNEKSQAIPVDGDLVVYGFDDTGRQHLGGDELTQADKRFRFTAEQFTSHFSEGELGASYSVWIPWDEAFGAPKKIMLIPTFKTKDGRLIRGSTANLNLPGKNEPESIPGLIQQASATIPTALPGQIPDARRQNSTALADPTTSGLRTTTIQVPASTLMNRTKAEESVIQADPISNATAQIQLERYNQWVQSQNNAATPALHFGETHATNTTAGNINAATYPPTQIPTLSPPNTRALNSTPQIVFDPPTAAPLMRANVPPNNPNGWALPEFSQTQHSGLSPRSSLNSPQAQATRAAPQASYPTR